MANKTSWTPGFVDTMNLGSENRALKERKTQINQAFSNQFNQIKNPQLDPTRANYQTYPYDYFSGSNAKIFFGDVWVDDIINIQYNITQSKTPIYGYASQNYDAVALGTIIVQGSLAIAFKETGYLNVIQYLLEAQAQNYNKAIQYTTALNVAEANAKLGKYIPGFSEGDPREMTGVVYGANGAPQIIRQQETIENILMSKKDNLVSQGLSKTIGLGNSSVGRDFEDFAEVLEDTIWGDSNGKPIGLGGVLRRADEFDYIYSSNSNETPVGVKVPRGNDYSKALNILLTFGDLNDFRAEHTLISLNDIHFQSQGLICSANGEPLAEMYNFFARDINKSINKKGSFKIDPIKFDFGSTETISKLEDVKKVEDYLNNNSAALIITLLSGLNKVDNIGWKSQNKVIDKVPFYKKEYEPILDQIIKITEQTINDTKNNVSTKYTQLAISVEPTNQKGLEKEASKINMILSQSVPNTLTFRVIAPTRSNFNAVSIISREDIFKDVPQANNMKDMKALAEEAVTQSIQKRNESAKNAITQANTKSAKIESELTDLATDKINQEIQKEQDKVNKYSSGEVSARDMRKIEEAEANIARLETQKQNVNSNNLSVLDSSKLTDYEQAQYNSLLEQQNIVNAQKEQSQTLVSNIETYQNKKETAEFNKLTSEIAKEKENLIAAITEVGPNLPTVEQEKKINNANERLQRLELERENNNTEFEPQSESETQINDTIQLMTSIHTIKQSAQDDNRYALENNKEPSFANDDAKKRYEAFREIDEMLGKMQSQLISANKVSDIPILRKIINTEKIATEQAGIEIQKQDFPVLIDTIQKTRDVLKETYTKLNSTEGMNEKDLTNLMTSVQSILSTTEESIPGFNKEVAKLFISPDSPNYEENVNWTSKMLTKFSENDPNTGVEPELAQILNNVHVNLSLTRDSQIQVDVPPIERLVGLVDTTMKIANEYLEQAREFMDADLKLIPPYDLNAMAITNLYNLITSAPIPTPTSETEKSLNLNSNISNLKPKTIYFTADPAAHLARGSNLAQDFVSVDENGRPIVYTPFAGKATYYSGGNIVITKVDERGVTEPIRIVMSHTEGIDMKKRSVTGGVPIGYNFVDTGKTGIYKDKTLKLHTHSVIQYQDYNGNWVEATDTQPQLKSYYEALGFEVILPTSASQHETNKFESRYTE